MQHIETYDNKTIIYNNDIEEIIIDQLTVPLDNLSPSVNKITIKKSINIYKRQNRIPYGCKFIIEKITINDINVFNNMREEDYRDITELELSDNNIAIVPEQISLLINLQILNLSYNKITAIPKEIKYLTNLQELYLNSNKIVAIPKEIKFLTNLQELILSNNKIVAIPEEIKFLTNLQELHLNTTKISAIPIEIINCRRLTKFNYYNNRIKVSDIKIIQFIERINYYQIHRVFADS